MHNNLYKAGLLAVAITLLSIASWEIYLRNTGLVLDFDDGEELWSHKRGRVYQPADKATVFIGSSRIKFGLDINTWKSLTGEEPVQLAVEGATPLPVLHHLANDNNFKGKLVIDVTEILFFSTSVYAAFEPERNIKYYQNITPSQQFSFRVSTALESQLLFLDKYNYSTNAMLDRLEIRNRPPVFQMPIFPPEFGRITIDRQCVMMDKFLADTNLQNMVKANWVFLAKSDPTPPPQGQQLDSIFNAVATSVHKLKERGVAVVFVRTPSSGPFFMGEQQFFPREQYWNRLLAATGCEGIHFTDYEQTANYVCPEFSHLSPADAKHYTTQLVNILHNEKGWKFHQIAKL